MMSICSNIFFCECNAYKNFNADWIVGWSSKRSVLLPQYSCLLAQLAPPLHQWKTNLSLIRHCVPSRFSLSWGLWCQCVGVTIWSASLARIWLFYFLVSVICVSSGVVYIVSNTLLHLLHYSSLLYTLYFKLYYKVHCTYVRFFSFQTWFCPGLYVIKGLFFTAGGSPVLRLCCIFYHSHTIVFFTASCCLPLSRALLSF